MTAIPLPPASRRSLWTVAQAVGLALTVALLAGLILAPEPSLHLLWDMVIPLLPAVFLVNPMIWRNVCPLATLNTIAGERGGGRRLRGGRLEATWVVGIVLLVAMVPARRFLFNESGLALAVTIAAVAALALGTGLLFSRRAGFCNTLCPVLPVEKLYGQAPLGRIGSVPCPNCTGCATLGCYDLVGGRSLLQSADGYQERGMWLLSPMGAFAAAFPGFVIGYFTTENGPLSSALGVYGHVALWMAGSYAVVALLALLLRIRAHLALPVLGGAALALYYWLSAPTLARAYGAADLGPAVIRVAAILLVVVWLVRAVPAAARADR